MAEMIIRMIAMNELGLWTPVEYPPSSPGRYLVAQRNGKMRYRWVRFWTGHEWSNIKLDQYGDIYAWAELPPYPSFD